MHSGHDRSWCDGLTRPLAIGAPVHLGQSRRGVDTGPSAIRYAAVRERLEVVEANPILDLHNTTAFTAVELIASLAGKTIP